MKGSTSKNETVPFSPSSECVPNAGRPRRIDTGTRSHAAAQHLEVPSADAIAEAARNQVERRDRWLNPPERVEWVDEPVFVYPKHPVSRNETAVKKLKE